MVRKTMLGLVCVALGACGTTGRDADVASVSNRFHAALEADDGAAACRELSPETRKALESQEERACEEAILDLDLPAGDTVARAKVYMTTAYVELAGPASAFLDEGPDGWKVSAAGCTAARTDRPFDCELES